MRTALETLKKAYKGKKLADGQQLGGRNGRLTDAKIHQLTVYYGSAIRSHINDLDSMKTACWGTYHSYSFSQYAFSLFQLYFIIITPHVTRLTTTIAIQKNVIFIRKQILIKRNTVYHQL